MIQEAYIQGISTRSVDDLVRAMGMTGISKSQVSRLCEEIDERVQSFLERPIEGNWPYLWLDATYIKVRRGRRIAAAPKAEFWRLSNARGLARLAQQAAPMDLIGHLFVVPPMDGGYLRCDFCPAMIFVQW